MKDKDIVFIGAGRIAEAWIERLLHSGATGRITACDPNAARLRELQLRYPGLRTSPDNLAGARAAEILILATPPAETVPALAAVRPVLGDHVTVLSLAAGAPMAGLAIAGHGLTVVRVMPNTPGMVGEGMNLVCFPPAIPDGQRQALTAWLNLFGSLLQIEEAQMEAFGALCAVGPTFLFPVMEALLASAGAAGLTPDAARQATAQLFIGCGRLLAATQRELPELNAMISMHTLSEAAAQRLFADAYQEALGKLQGLAAKLAAAA